MPNCSQIHAESILNPSKTGPRASPERGFRTVIEKSLQSTNKTNYFDKWGNRVYAFYPKGNPNLLNFCSAYRIGARYVISNEQIKSETVDEVQILNSKDNIILYRIFKRTNI